MIAERVGFSGSYPADDVTFLLQPITVPPVDVETKEHLIQSGARHYSEMLSPEKAPGAAYMALYEQALATNGPRLGADIAVLARALAEREPGRPVVLVSLARAGTPIAVLLRRALIRMGVAAPHYSVSIIRDRGIDERALAWIVDRHDPADVVFVDGWTGKGAIARELRKACADSSSGVQPFLVVVADPAGQADLAATADDYVIASGLLNGVVSGLVSRSVLNDAVIASGGFHGCVVLDHLAAQDVTRDFIETIDAHVRAAPHKQADWSPERRPALQAASAALVRRMMETCGVADVNRIKPGVAEAARAVLRRVPERLFMTDPDDPDLRPLGHLARERNLTIERLDQPCPYKAVAIIRSLGGE